MKGFIGKALAALGFAGMLLSLNGCCIPRYRDVVDTCYPERYWAASRNSVNAAFAPQVRNGHVLDQTVWNYHFETDDEGKPTDRLTLAGQDKLAYLARRRPHPDPVIFVQTAQDIGYDPKKPEEFVQDRRNLNQLRKIAVQKYLAAQTAGRHAQFNIMVHDPAEVGQAGLPVDNAIFSAGGNRNARGMYNSTRGTLPGTGLTTSISGGQ